MYTQYRGYRHPRQYLDECERRNRASQGLFSLRFALQHWQQRLPAGQLRQRLGARPRCLLSGCASPDNVPALLEFLAAQDMTPADVHVVDLIDLSALGQRHPHANYHVADAGALGPLFEDGSFDLVIQDHLLNCAPIPRYNAILRENARVLRRGAVALLHYTGSDALPPPTASPTLQATVRAALQRGESDIHLPAAIQLPLQQRLLAYDEGVTLITAPHGHLEYFIPAARLQHRLQKAGLAVEHHAQLHITDAQGLPCQRHHWLLRR